MTDLPVNIDAVYQNRSPGDAAHQQHHDRVHATVNDVDNAYDVAVADGYTGTRQAWLEQIQANANATSAAPLNLRDFGAVGDGVTDDTAAFDAWLAACIAEGRPGGVPQGTFVYNGPGLDPGPTFAIVGLDPIYSKILVTSDAYFLDNTSRASRITFANLTVQGGKGVYREKGTANATGSSSQKNVHRCTFSDFTECGWQINSADSPYWHVVDTAFRGASSVGTIGFAHAGLSNQSRLEGCNFTNLQVGVKLAVPDDFQIINTAFINGAHTAGTRVSLWIVPAPTAGLVGDGFVVRDTKFGGENQAPGDLQVLYAAELAGTYIGDKLPDLVTESTGVAQGHTFDTCRIAGADGRGPFIYSTTPNVRGLRILNCAIAGTDPTFMLEFAASLTDPQTNASLPFDRTNVLAFTFEASTNIGRSSAYPRPCNRAGYFTVIDPTGQWVGDADTGNYHAGNDDGYSASVVIQPDAAAFTLAGTATKIGTVTDLAGGTDAAECTTPGFNDRVHTPATALAVGVLTWVEVDLRQAAADSATHVEIHIRENDLTPAYFRRIVRLPAGWRRFWWPMVTRTVAANLKFDVQTLNNEAGGFAFGRVRIYQAPCPVNTLDRIVYGDLSFDTDAQGPILIDRTTGTSYRLHVTDGILAIEAV